MSLLHHFEDPKNVQFWKALFEPCETVVAHYQLYNELKQQRPDVAVGMNRLLFYICNIIVFGHPTEKNENGNLGYRMHFKSFSNSI
jgi:hypothetical protein